MMTARDDALARANGALPGALGRRLSALRLFTVLAEHESIFPRWFALTEALLRGSLPPRLRELLILRTVWNCDCTYEWRNHLVIASHELGFGAPELIALTQQNPSWPWPPIESDIVAAADILSVHTRLPVSILSRLREQLNQSQVLEVFLVVAQYSMLSTIATSFQVEFESVDDLVPAGVPTTCGSTEPSAARGGASEGTRS